jgi:large subunit ribosomal protein L1
MQGPRGIMPNPKSGNITNDVTAAFTKLQAGQVAFKTDKVSPCHICTGTGLTPPTSAPGLGSVTAQCLGAPRDHWSSVVPHCM